MKKRHLIKFMVTTAIFAALSIILDFIKFPLPFIFPAFLKIQFSNLPAIIGGFILGPFGGVLILVIKTLILLPSSNTAYVGEIADFIIGASVVVVSSLIYLKFHTKKGGLVALVFGSIAWVVMAVLANYLILVPLYIELFFKGETADFVAACSIIPGINENNYLLMYTLLTVIPFNLLISTVVNIVTFFVYKKISNIIVYKQ